MKFMKIKGNLVNINEVSFLCEPHIELACDEFFVYAYLTIHLKGGDKIAIDFDEKEVAMMKNCYLELKEELLKL